MPVGAAGNALDEAVDNDQDLNLTLTVSNLGNVPINLDVTVTPTLPSWPLAIFCESLEDDNSLSLSLSEGESVDCRIQIHVPAEVSNGESNTINIRTQFTLSNFILNRTELKVEERPELSLSPSPVDVMNVAPGQASYGSFMIANEGNVPLNLDWEFGSVPEGWQVGFKSIPIDNLGMHRTDEVQISVLMPPNTPIGPLEGDLTLMVTGTTYGGQELVRTATMGFVGIESAWLTLSTDGQDFSKLSDGEIRSDNLTVTNDGNTPCKVDFEISADSTWIISGLDTIQNLEPGSSQTLQFTLMNDGAVGLGTITISAIPTSAENAILINGSSELSVSSSSLSGESGGLLQALEEAGIPSWVIGLISLIILGSLVGLVLMLRKSRSTFDSGEQILSPGSTMMGSVEQRRDAALDIGVKTDDMVSGSVSDSEIAAALAASGPKPLSPPKPPGPPPAPLGAPPLPDGSPPPPPPYS